MKQYTDIEQNRLSTMTQEEKAKAYNEAHMKDVRERAAIAAMQGMLSNSAMCLADGDTYPKVAVRYADALMEELEKQGEQKSADQLEKAMADAGYEFDFDKQELKKIEDEPKFKVGEWVVNKYGDSWHIDSFDKKNYQVSDGKGNNNYFSIDFQDEMHLWTIADAKGGDVLCTGNGNLFIFKERKDDVIYDYCGFYNNVFYTWSGSPNGTMVRSSYNDYKPASKEQHELLFQKMKEADYEWNDEKKELKKIEQYNPYEAVVKSIAEMCKRYNSMDLDSLKDFFHNVKVKCKDAVEYDSIWGKNCITQ